MPFWVYSDNPEPTSTAECLAKISSLEFTLKDIELQIELREIEMRTGSSRHASNLDYDKWRVKVLKAKQTHLYTLNAYQYWLLLHDSQERPMDVNTKLNKLIRLLIDEPKDLFEQLEKLL